MSLFTGECRPISKRRPEATNQYPRPQREMLIVETGRSRDENRRFIPRERTKGRKSYNYKLRINILSYIWIMKIENRLRKNERNEFLNCVYYLLSSCEIDETRANVRSFSCIFAHLRASSYIFVRLFVPAAKLINFRNPPRAR